MSVLEMAQTIGKQGLYHVEGGFHVDVKVNDVKSVYGQTRFLITPVSGEGAKWVDSGKVSGLQTSF